MSKCIFQTKLADKTKHFAFNHITSRCMHLDTDFTSMQNTFWIGKPPVDAETVLPAQRRAPCPVAAELGYCWDSQAGNSGLDERSDSAANYDSASSLPVWLDAQAHGVHLQNSIDTAVDVSRETISAQQLDWV
jgi:hypothetical protein